MFVMLVMLLCDSQEMSGEWEEESVVTEQHQSNLV